MGRRPQWRLQPQPPEAGTLFCGAAEPSELIPALLSPPLAFLCASKPQPGHSAHPPRGQGQQRWRRCTRAAAPAHQGETGCRPPYESLRQCPTSSLSAREQGRQPRRHAGQGSTTTALPDMWPGALTRHSLQQIAPTAPQWATGGRPAIGAQQRGLQRQHGSVVEATPR